MAIPHQRNMLWPQRSVKDETDHFRLADNPGAIASPPLPRRETISLKHKADGSGNGLLAFSEAVPTAFWATQDCPLCRSFSACQYGRQADHR